MLKRNRALIFTALVSVFLGACGGSGGPESFGIEFEIPNGWSRLNPEEVQKVLHVADDAGHFAIWNEPKTELVVLKRVALNASSQSRINTYGEAAKSVMPAELEQTLSEEQKTTVSKIMSVLPSVESAAEKEFPAYRRTNLGLVDLDGQLAGDLQFAYELSGEPRNARTLIYIHPETPEAMYSLKLISKTGSASSRDFEKMLSSWTWLENSR